MGKQYLPKELTKGFGQKPKIYDAAFFDRLVMQEDCIFTFGLSNGTFTSGRILMANEEYDYIMITDSTDDDISKMSANQTIIPIKHIITVSSKMIQKEMISKSLGFSMPSTDK